LQGINKLLCPIILTGYGQARDLTTLYKVIY